MSARDRIEQIRSRRYEGAAGEDSVTCPDCEGEGEVWVEGPAFLSELETCGRCDGSGEVDASTAEASS